MKQATEAECEDMLGEGDPSVTRMSHHRHSDWGSDITAALSEEESNSPQMSFTVDG